MTRPKLPRDDPYWDAFIHRAPADPNNVITHAFKQVKPGGVNPVKTEVHSPNVMSAHVKELARFYGADLVGIVALDTGFGIVCGVRTDYDSQSAVGIGGQTPAMKGLFATFTLGAYIRELGYTADASEADRERLAAAAGLGTLDAGGRLVTRQFGRNVQVTDVMLTDLPLEPDGRA
ncbi:MAG: hypothetical protein JO352_36840 [Chloroflexi bacterium]|nr:hypothetical protein [Chloroflexota bacterium]MBV9600461.1 hypothetical protein [Chloroflexota bacterium]